MAEVNISLEFRFKNIGKKRKKEAIKIEEIKIVRL